MLASRREELKGNPRKTAWARYEDITEKAKLLLVRLSTGYEIEQCASLWLCIVRSYENNCNLSIKVEGSRPDLVSRVLHSSEEAHTDL